LRTGPSNQLKLCRLHHRQVAGFRSLEEAADEVNLAPSVVGARRKVPAAVEFPRKALASNRFSGERFTRRGSVTASNSRSRAARSGGSFTTRPCTALKVRAASTLLPTLFPSPTGSRLSPSSSHGAIHEMAQTGRSHVRYVDPQRRYTVVLGPSWNAPFGALPHDDRAGTHDGADGQCGSYASIGRGQAATNIFRRYPQRV
jgi:hypothetical protein